MTKVYFTNMGENVANGIFEISNCASFQKKIKIEKML